MMRRFFFPVKLQHADKGELILEEKEWKKIADYVASMKIEHDKTEESMIDIRRLTNDFRALADTGEVGHILFKNLQLFATNLQMHVHLGNDILFPEALELEYRFEQQFK